MPVGANESEPNAREVLPNVSRLARAVGLKPRIEAAVANPPPSSDPSPVGVIASWAEMA
jgi:hypothetical protein